MQIKYKPVAVKQLLKLPSQAQNKIINKLELLTSYPYSGKPLKGELEGLRSLRAWPYRIVYEIKNKSIIILSIVHRQSAY